PFLFVDALAAKGSGDGQNERPSLSLGAINFAEFVQLHVANASVCIPLNSLQHPGYERRSQDGFVFRHWIEKPHWFHVRPESPLSRLIAECHGNDFRVACCSEPRTQYALFRFERQRRSVAAPLRQSRGKFVEPVMPRNLLE